MAGCEDDWIFYNGWCYYYTGFIFPALFTDFDTAKSQCEEMDANLASIGSREEDEFLISLVSSQGQGGHNNEIGIQLDYASNCFYHGGIIGCLDVH